MEGVIFNIQKFSVNDGPGIRTTVFLKGCPLNCIWCHNPESKSVNREIMLFAEKCVLCNRCLDECPMGCHVISDGVHTFFREKCVLCTRCVEACQTGAIEAVGRTVSASDVIDEVLKDKIFYETSGGGMTISGGEPLMQAEFSLELLRLARNAGIHTAVETSGYAKEEVIRSIAPYTDLFLYDCKLCDDKRHKEYTGVSNESILRNLRLIDALGKDVVLRCPIIPTVNDNEEHFSAVSRLADSLSCVLRIEVLPYHPLGEGKAIALGRDYALSGMDFPDEETVNGWIERIKQGTAKEVKRG